MRIGDRVRVLRGPRKGQIGIFLHVMRTGELGVFFDIDEDEDIFDPQDLELETYVQETYIRIEAPDHIAARDRMCALYGMNWSMQYNGTDEDPGGIERFGLVELDVLEIAGINGPRLIEFESRKL